MPRSFLPYLTQSSHLYPGGCDSQKIEAEKPSNLLKFHSHYLKKKDLNLSLSDSKGSLLSKWPSALASNFKSFIAAIDCISSS